MKIKVLIDDEPAVIDNSDITCDFCYGEFFEGDKLYYADIINPENDQCLIPRALIHEGCVDDSWAEYWWSSSYRHSPANNIFEKVVHMDEKGNITNPQTVKKEMIKAWKRGHFREHSAYSPEELWEKEWKYFVEG